jgi:hypothetical protein
MFGLGFWEIVIILIVLAILLGTAATVVLAIALSAGKRDDARGN